MILKLIGAFKMTNWINEKKQLVKYIENNGWTLKDDYYTGYTHRKNKTIINGKV